MSDEFGFALGGFVDVGLGFVGFDSGSPDGEVFASGVELGFDYGSPDGEDFAFGR